MTRKETYTKAYEEALRRIEKAKETEALELNLNGLLLNRLPQELSNLTSIRSLNLDNCYELRDLWPLARLTSLKSLELNQCRRLRNLSPLATLTSLQSLSLGSEQVSDISPLRDLKSLQTLGLYSANQISDISSLSGLNSLQTLALRGCWLLSDLSPLSSLSSLRSLDLYGSKHLSNLSPLSCLTSLRSLALDSCWDLNNLSPLVALTSLQSLTLHNCPKLRDRSPLARLTSLRTLDLTAPLASLSPIQWGRFAPLESLLPTLQHLRLHGCKFDDLPPEVCGEVGLNCLDKVRAHYADLKYGARRDAALKVFFLGNASVGKTQLSRRLCDLPFDPNTPTTHGIQLGQTSVTLDGFQQPVRLNLWDFGGQDIYHGSHALFLQGQAVFLVLWMPDLEQGGSYEQSGIMLRHRPLAYWLDYLRAFAGTDASVLIVQSQCDTRDKRILHPPATVDDLPFHRYTEVSARTGLNLGILKESINEAVRDRFDRFPPKPIGSGRLKVRDRLRQMLEEDQQREPVKRQHRLLEREEFERLCAEVGGISDPEALLDFLHHTGVIFYRSGFFGGRIVLDQNWALEAIYALFDRKKILPLLRGYGRFSRADLESLIWSDFAPEEQKIFLETMESCGICFRVRELPRASHDGNENDEKEWEYIAPELLPKWSDAQELLFGRLREDPPDAEASARYTFLHEGVLRGYLSKLGEYAKDAAIYWKYGCWFYEQTTRSQVLIESQWDDAESEFGAGNIRFRAWGERADDLIKKLLRSLQSMPVGQPPEIKRIHNAKVAINAMVGVLSYGTVELGASRLDNLEIPVHPDLPNKNTPEVFVSYARGDDSSDDARKRTEAVDRLCEALDKDAWHILRDKTEIRPGDLISGFMKRIGLADHVIVVLSDKYLCSPYCMTELHYIYQRSLGEKEEFLRRIIPLALDDARFGTWRDRLVYTKHWRAEFEEMELNFKDLGEADFRLYKSMQEWHNRIGDMLAYLNDVLSPRGFDDIVKDNFAGLRQMLSG
jgi:internalin A